MKKILAIAITSLFMSSCSTQTITKENQESETKVMENVEQDYHGSKIWVGEINEESFQKEPYSDWYKDNFEYYTVDQETVDQFKNDLRNYDITVFMGTWCGDSKAITPEFFKIMEAANYPDSKITMYGVDRSKKSLNGEEEGKNITHVPTIIFYINGKEVNRIVESPINTLEEDILAIVSGAAYTPNYSD